uniref:Exosome complex component N-terminal domain-containing protein n=1 Tax=Panagrolaimus superbus TaxID=310955 RepID=A0A914XQL4_9BILA
MPRRSGRKTNNMPAKKKTCIPGDKLFNVSDGYKAGFGTYQERGAIIASLYGFVCVSESKNSADGKENEKTVEVQQSEEGVKYIMPVIGTVVTARIVSITTKLAKCSIFCVQDCILPVEFSSTLRKEDMLESEYNKRGLWEYVKPGDIILARVLGMGDVQTSYLLSIAENELGVTTACGENGETMIPKDLHTVFSAKSGYEESRKVAQIPYLNA